MKQVKHATADNPVRGKYAAAFKAGVAVVKHGVKGDETYRVTRDGSGKFRWEPVKKPQ